MARWVDQLLQNFVGLLYCAELFPPSWVGCAGMPVGILVLSADRE